MRHENEGNKLETYCSQNDHTHIKNAARFLTLFDHFLDTTHYPVRVTERCKSSF